jgi:acyl-CoA thioesterase I
VKSAPLASLIFILAGFAGAACAPPADPPAPAPAATASEAPSPIADAPVVLFLGTSLTAGLGLDPAQAYPERIAERIRAAGLPHRVVNAGVSGETAAAARRRLDWLLKQRVDVLVIETGANDGLRGQDPDATRADIQALIDRAREQRPAPRVLLVGMQAPPNLGRPYAERFRAIYPELARANDVALVPFLLDGVGGVAALNQADGVHPTAEGQERVAENVWKVLRPLLTPGGQAP